MKKRGAVEISLSMIIIIIIAVIVLISGLGLITGGLDRVKEIWEGAMRSAETQLREQPSYDKPIVWSLGDVSTVTTGKEYVVEVAVLNTGSSDMSNTPSLICSGLTIEFKMPTGSKTIADGNTEKWKGTFKVTSGNLDTYICKLNFGTTISEEIAITTT